MRLLIYIGLIIVCAIILLFFADQDNELTVGLLTGIMTGLAVPLVDSGVTNTPYVRLLYYSLKLRNQYVRISASYLYRIKQEGEYMLVRGYRFPNQFQPIGGVFKILPEARVFLDRIEALDDDLISIDATSKDDLRIRVKGRHLIAFMRWYDEGKERETAPWREFYEELVRPGILSHADFPWVYHRHIRRVQQPIRFSEYVQAYEFLIADVYELLPTEKQKEKLQELRSTDADTYIWTDEGHIRRRGVTPKARSEMAISQTASWTL